MKTIFGLLATLVSVSGSWAQDNTNQNPNYKQSMDYYMKHKDELQVAMNTTPQETYKAFDWYQNKIDRRQERRNARNERRLARAMAPNYYYHNPRYRNYRYYNDSYSNWNDDCWWFWL